MKQFSCGSLVPGCGWHTRSEDDAEIIRRASQHLRTAHNEIEIRPDMIERIKARITDQSNAA